MKINPKLPTDLPPQGITDRVVAVYTDSSRTEDAEEVTFRVDLQLRAFIPRSSARMHRFMVRWLHAMPEPWYGFLVFAPGELPADCPLEVAFGGPRNGSPSTS